MARCQVLCVMEQRKEENDVKIKGGGGGESMRLFGRVVIFVNILGEFVSVFLL